MNYRAFHKLSYGLYIVTTNIGEKKYGYIGNTVFQVTSDPSQIAISCHKNNFTTKKIIESGKFSISVLKKEVNTSIIGEFGFMSGTEINKFRNIETITAVTGAPIVIDSSVAWFDCILKQTVDVGSHLLFIGEVKDSDLISNDEPLTYAYYREKYKMFSPKNSPTYIEKEKLESEPEVEKSALNKKDLPEEEETREKSLSKFTCNICGFQYDPEEGDPSMGIPPGTPFEDLPDDYRCPICNAGKDDFRKNS